MGVSGPGTTPARAARERASTQAEHERVSAAIVWHDLECGEYTADLALWRALADEHATPPGSQAILDIGAGTGRVAIDLAARGHRVTAVDIEPELLAELQVRAAGLGVQALCADARALELPRRDYALCLVPMQTLQLLGGTSGRAAFLARAHAHLREGALLCCALVTAFEEFDVARGDPEPAPELARVGERLFVSRACSVRANAHTIAIERVRSVGPAAVHARPSPSSSSSHASSCSREQELIELDRLDAPQLCREALAAGFAEAGSETVPATADHVGSTVVMLRA
jgi:SAM-dependent methyltransferase